CGREIGAGKRPSPGRLEPLRGARTEAPQNFVRRADALVAEVRLLEVIADDLFVFADPGAGDAFEPRREPLVQLRARRLRKRVVRGVPDQDVAEPVRIVAGEARASRPDQIAADERGEVALQR